MTHIKHSWHVGVPMPDMKELFPAQNIHFGSSVPANRLDPGTISIQARQDDGTLSGPLFLRAHTYRDLYFTQEGNTLFLYARRHWWHRTKLHAQIDLSVLKSLPLCLGLDLEAWEEDHRRSGLLFLENGQYWQLEYARHIGAGTDADMAANMRQVWGHFFGRGKDEYADTFRQLQWKLDTEIPAILRDLTHEDLKEHVRLLSHEASNFQAGHNIVLL